VKILIKFQQHTNNILESRFLLDM